MAVAEKSGMVVNAEKEVIGWVNAGEEVDLREGDQIVTHHKTAEKLGLAAEYAEQKAANAPVKEPKAKKEEVDGEEGEKKVRGPRVAIPREGRYTVLKPDFKAIDDTERGQCYKTLASFTELKDFYTNCSGYKHTSRDGSNSFDVDPSVCVGYALKRGMIAMGDVEVPVAAE